MRALTLAICAATALTPITASAASAAAGPQVSDARCLLTMATIAAQSKDQTTALQAQMGVAFFAGRLKAREPAYNFAAGLKGAAIQMAGAEIKGELQRCGPIIGPAMEQLNTGLQALSPPGPPPAAPAPAPGK